MGHERQMRQFLNELDRHLTSIDILERSSIIANLKEKLEQRLANDPETSLSKIIKELGPVDQLANQYLLEYGIKPKAKMPSFSFWKMLFWGWMGSVALILAWLSFMVLKFSPVFHVDEEHNRVVILGGLIEIDGEKGKIKAMDRYHFAGSSYQNHFDGDLSVTKKIPIDFHFQEGRLHLSTSTQQKLQWKCRLSQAPEKNPIEHSKKKLTFDFRSFSGSDCQLSIPKDYHLKVKAENGSIYLEKPSFHSSIQMDNGEVMLRRKPENFYNIKTTIKNGHSDLKDDAKGYKLEIKLNNGSIHHF